MLLHLFPYSYDFFFMIICIHVFKIFQIKLKVMFYMGISLVPKVEHSIFKVKSKGHFIENLYIPYLSGVYMRINLFHQNLDHFYKTHAFEEGHIEIVTS